MIYVIKENRTYDQVFGDLGKGNGDPSLTLFKDGSAPNQRALARRFTLLDNFYVDAEVSQDGHPWSTQATATDYVDKIWPFDYAWAYYRSYDSEFVPLAQQFASEPLAGDPTVPRTAAAATVGYLWDDAYKHGVSFRDYGEGTPWDDPHNCHSGTVYSDLTHLQARFGEHVDPRFPGWNLDCSDHAVREPSGSASSAGTSEAATLPGLEVVYLPNDHTQGTTPGTATPASYEADNDVARRPAGRRRPHSRLLAEYRDLRREDDAHDGPTTSTPTAPRRSSSARSRSTRGSTRRTTTPPGMLGTVEDILGSSR